MLHDDLIAVLIGLVAFTIFLLPAFFFGKRHNRTGLKVLWLIWSAFTGLFFFGMQATNGWDPLGYFILLLVISAPSGLGCFIGGIAGWWKKEAGTT